jgi:hypothetical protein
MLVSQKWLKPAIGQKEYKGKKYLHYKWRLKNVCQYCQCWNEINILKRFGIMYLDVLNLFLIFIKSSMFSKKYCIYTYIYK